LGLTDFKKIKTSEEEGSTSILTFSLLTEGNIFLSTSTEYCGTLLDHM
jgi:hypothetical protein